MTNSAAAKALGKAGGEARAASLSASRRRAIAKKAARARWDKPKQKATRQSSLKKTLRSAAMPRKDA